MANSKRKKTDYINQPLLDGLRVLKALEGTDFEPVSILRVSQRAGVSYGKCRAALITLEVDGFAKQTVRGWMLGASILRFSERFAEHCLTKLGNQQPG